MTDSNTIGERIRKLREEKNETQAELGKHLLVKRETINQWEKGTRDIKTQYTLSLANHFKTTCDYLLGVSPNRTNDIEILNVCQKTGLSERAYEMIVRINSVKYDFDEETIQNSKYGFILNAFIENDLFFEIVKKTQEILVKCITQVSVEDQEDLMEINIIRLKKRFERLIEDTLKNNMTDKIKEYISEMEYLEAYYNDIPVKD